MKLSIIKRGENVKRLFWLTMLILFIPIWLALYSLSILGLIANWIWQTLYYPTYDLAGKPLDKKNWLGKLLCRHKNKGWFTKTSKFHALNGERQYQICEDCGKELDERFIPYD